MSKKGVEQLEEAAFTFLCAVEDLRPELPRDLYDCAKGVAWGLRGTLGEELKRHGASLRLPGGRKKKK
jgi:hypothetical protein